jgi:hypothetical protein
MKNEYEIFEKRIGSNKAITKIPILLAKEKSNFCIRQFCSPAIRGMDVAIYNTTGGMETKCLLIEKDFTVPFYCLFRP